MRQIQQHNTLSIIIRVRQLLHTGKKFTAVDINRIVSFNDLRKVISELRAQGMNILDYKLPDGRKNYWLVGNDRQQTLPFAYEKSKGGGK
jgi:hypothetical protein